MKKKIGLVMFSCFFLWGYADNRPEAVGFEEMKRNVYQGLYHFNICPLADYHSLPFYRLNQTAYLAEKSIYIRCPELAKDTAGLLCEWMLRVIPDSAIFKNGCIHTYRSDKSPFEMFLANVYDEKTKKENVGLLYSLGEKYGWWKKYVRCPWLNGDITILLEPKCYFGMYLTRRRQVGRAEKGIIRNLTPVKEMLRLGVLDSIAAGKKQQTDFEHWIGSFEQEMRFLSDTINKMSSKPSGKGEERHYALLVYMDEKGYSHLHLLASLQGKPGYEIKELKKTIRALPRRAFTMLWTMDGRAFPGRYLKAWYHPQKGWRFADYYDENLFIGKSFKKDKGLYYVY